MSAGRYTPCIRTRDAVTHRLSLKQQVVVTIVLNWIEINRYATIIGPGVGRPARPVACPWCSATRVRFDGWRVVFAVVLADGSPHRFDDGLPIRRVCCAACDVS